MNKRPDYKANNVTPRILIELLQKLPENEKDLPLMICGAMSAECDPTQSIRIQDDHTSSYGPRLFLLEDF